MMAFEFHQPLLRKLALFDLLGSLLVPDVLLHTSVEEVVSDNHRLLDTFP